MLQGLLKVYCIHIAVYHLNKKDCFDEQNQIE